MTVGEAMRAAREEAGLTQYELAAITGISPTSLNQYERDKHTPRIDMAEMLADTLGISIDEYVGHVESKGSSPNAETFTKIKQLTKMTTAKEIAERLKKSIVDTVIKEMAVDLNE
jgi:transcriptional regulator with XRE-family HTH domain